MGLLSLEKSGLRGDLSAYQDLKDGDQENEAGLFSVGKQQEVQSGTEEV